MTYAIVWKYSCPTNGTRVLMGHPGAYLNTQEEAITEARLILEKLEGYGVEISPLATVETEPDLNDDIADGEELYLGPDDDDEIFYVVSHMKRWNSTSWWPSDI